MNVGTQSKWWERKNVNNTSTKCASLFYFLHYFNINVDNQEEYTECKSHKKYTNNAIPDKFVININGRVLVKL